MNYVYDILVNFNETLYDFYDWNLDDHITHIRRIPIYKIESERLNEIRNHVVKFDQEFLEIVKNRTEYFSGRNVKIIKYAFLLTDGIDIIGFLVGDKMKYTCLQIDEELDVLEEVEFKPYPVKYEIIAPKTSPILKTRYQLKQENKIREKLKELKKENNIPKIQYLYYECFNKKESKQSFIFEQFNRGIENREILNKLISFFEVHKQIN